jgi:iron complex outermembrane receptor protein
VENLLSYPCRNWLFHLGINGSYTVATTFSSYLPNDGSIGKQIPYTPRVAAQANAGFKIADLYFNVNETVTGSRYVNTDETGMIDPYCLTNLQSSYNFKLRQSNFFVSAQVNNILNRPYEVVKDRPMPGINWVLSLQWQGIF